MGFVYLAIKTQTYLTIKHRPTASSLNQPSPTVSKLFVFSCRSGLFSNYWSIQTTWVSSPTADTRKEIPGHGHGHQIVVVRGRGDQQHNLFFLTFIYYNNLQGRIQDFLIGGNQIGYRGRGTNERSELRAKRV